MWRREINGVLEFRWWIKGWCWCEVSHERFRKSKMVDWNDEVETSNSPCKIRSDWEKFSFFKTTIPIPFEPESMKLRIRSSSQADHCTKYAPPQLLPSWIQNQNNKSVQSRSTSCIKWYQYHQISFPYQSYQSVITETTCSSFTEFVARSLRLPKILCTNCLYGVT